MSLGLFDTPLPAAEKTPPRRRSRSPSQRNRARHVFSLDAAWMIRLQPLRALLADEQTAKSLHDLKAALRILGQHGADHGLRLAGEVDDLMLYSYLINPTHATHPLPDVVARFSGRALPPPGDELLPASANAIRSLAPCSKKMWKRSVRGRFIAISTCRWFRSCCVWKRPACALTAQFSPRWASGSR